MTKDTRFTRSVFLKYLFTTAAGLGLAQLGTAQARKQQQGTASLLYLPLVMQGSGEPTLRGRVIHMHAPNVTNWDFNSSLYYGRTQSPGVVGVNQGVVDAMVDRGVTELVGMPLSAVVEAWKALLPNYTAGQVVAIKVNLNNSFSCATSGAAADAIAQPINAVVRGLKLRGVRYQDIVVYDAIRAFPDRVYQELTDQNIQIHDSSGCHGSMTTFNSSDPHAVIQFYPPSGSLDTTRVSDSLINAAYLINMPIMKGHSLAGVTLGFKNHFGTTNDPGHMHDYVSTSYRQIDVYDALVDLYSNPHIRDKTVLTIGDGIYGSRQTQGSSPTPWATFGNQAPCSLFFSADPVAVDCVMHDLLKAERTSAQPGTSNSYLNLAANAGLGLFESGDPWQLPYGAGYSKISYKRIEL